MILRVVVLTAIACACNRAPAATTEFFGPTIEPPRGLEKIQPGMTVAEAKRLVPALREEHGGVRERLVVDSGVNDVKLEVRIDAGRVASIFAIVQNQSVREILSDAWGEPQLSRDVLNQPEIAWSSEATGWKVKLDCLERNCLLEYVPYHPLTPEFFGAHVVPPGDLAKLRIGMKLPEARMVAPAVIDVRAGIPTGVDGVRQFVAVDDKLGSIRAIYVNLPAQAEPLIAEAWGNGKLATEPVGKSVLVWHDPTTGWRATLRPALGDSRDLAFDNFLPVAQLLGEQPDVLDAAPVLGKTVEEVKALFKQDVAPAGKNELVLTLLPTEWERTATKITLATAGNRVREIGVSIPYKANPDSREQLFEMFQHKWGAPRPIEEGGKRVYVFRDGQPRVEISDDPDHDAWKLEIR